jgi:hypothetical protein
MRVLCSEFDEQVAHFYPGCGIPAKLQGHMDFLETDTYTASNADIARQRKDKRRKVIELDASQPVVSIRRKVIHYKSSSEPTLMQVIVDKMYEDFPIVRRPISLLFRLGVLPWLYSLSERFNVKSET